MIEQLQKLSETMRRICHNILVNGTYGDYYVVFRSGNMLALQHMVSLEFASATLPDNITNVLDSMEKEKIEC